MGAPFCLVTHRLFPGVALGGRPQTADTERKLRTGNRGNDASTVTNSSEDAALEESDPQIAKRAAAARAWIDTDRSVALLARLAHATLAARRPMGALRLDDAAAAVAEEMVVEAGEIEEREAAAEPRVGVETGMEIAQ